MLGRYGKPDGFHALFRPGDALRVLAAGLLVAAGLFCEHALSDPPGWTVAFPLLSLLLTGGPIVWGALKGLARFKSNVDELVSIAIVATIVLSEYNSAAIVAFIMALGSLVEEFTSNRARRAVEAVLGNQPKAVVLVEEGLEREIPVEEVEPGQRIRVRPGDVFPIDGTVLAGRTCVDESSITGEPLPKNKSPGDPVSSGTLNMDGFVEIEAARPAAESTLARIAKLIQEAEAHRAPVMRVAERYARFFTPAILLISGATWLVTGDPIRAVTVLIVGCPCAFVLATPTAVVAALGAAARKGILVKGGKFLEACGEVDQVDFDKTGTITEAAFRVAQVWPASGRTEEQVLALAAAAELGSEHPIGRAVVEEARSRGIGIPAAPADFSADRGLGVTSGGTVVGNRGYMELRGIATGADASEAEEAASKAGRTTLFVASGGEVAGVISLEDKVRPEASAVVGKLMEMGLSARMLTGDREAPARAAAAAAGLREIRSGMLPADKQAAIREAKEMGRRIAFVGDGANDGPALAEAHVGVSLASRRNTVAIETADAVLMDGGLTRLPELFALGRRARRTILQNLLFFGLAFNAAMLALSALGVLSPVLGALAHNAGSILVVLNSARLLRGKGLSFPPHHHGACCGARH